MSKKEALTKPSLIRYTKDTVARELSAWISLFSEGWKWLLLSILGLFILTVFTKPLPPRDVYLAVGQKGSLFEGLGKKYVSEFAQQGVRLHLVNTKGSVANMTALVDKDDSVSAAITISGVANKGEYKNIYSLGSIEYVPLWLFYRGEEFKGKRAYEFFMDKRVAIGNKGSASENVLRKVLSLSDITLEKRENFLNIPDQEAIQLVLDGKIDAVCIMDGLNGENVQKLLKQTDIHILSFPYAPAYAKKLPIYSTVVVPMGSLDLKAYRPEKDIVLLAATASLLVDEDVHPVIQQLFLLAAKKISLETDPFFSAPEYFPTYVDRTFSLSQVAQKFYEQGPPSFRDRLPLWLIDYAGRVWFLLLGAFAVIYPLFKLFPSYRRMHSSMIIGDAFEELRNIEQQTSQAQSIAVLQSLIEQLNRLDAVTTECSITSEEIKNLYSMKSAMNLVRQRIEKNIKAHEL